jgi:hypothetical protein
MLTWAMVYLVTQLDHYRPIFFIGSMVGDVLIAYFIACAVTGNKP